MLAAAVAVATAGTAWTARADASTRRTEQRGQRTTGVVTSSHTDSESGNVRVCVRFETSRSIVSTCPYAASSRPTGASVPVRYLAAHPTTAVIEGDLGGDEGPIDAAVLIALGLVVAGAAEIVGRRPRVDLGGMGWRRGPAAAPDLLPPSVGAVAGSPVSTWDVPVVDGPASSGESEGSEPSAIASLPPPPVLQPRVETVEWRWTGIGFRGLRYRVSDASDRELARLRVGVFGTLRAISTARHEYRVRTLPIPGRMRVSDTATGTRIATWHRMGGVVVEGRPKLLVTRSRSVGEQSAEVGFVGPDGVTRVRVRFDLPLKAASLHRRFPSGSALLVPTRHTGVVEDADVVLVALAFQVLAMELSPKGGA